MLEVWKPLNERYQVSSLGRVKGIYKGKETLLKPSVSTTGYEMVTMSVEGKRKTCSVHRLVAEAFLDIRSAKVVNHKDGDRTNNMLYNLEMCSYSDNSKHIHKGKKRFVFKNKRTNTFKVEIKKDKIQRYVGSYKTKEEAYEAAYDAYFKLFNTYPWSK